MGQSSALARGAATRFAVSLGVVSLFADMTYEGARSISGPFLAHLEATGTVVGIVAGLGELLAYGLRLASGYWVSRTHRYWGIAGVGYVINLAAVPLLALARSWPAAASLLVAERFGKAVRSPARDTMLSHAGHVIGRGWVFGLHEAMDQTGALVGPLLVALVLHRMASYRAAFALLAVPAVLSYAALVRARLTYPRPRDLEGPVEKVATRGYPRVFWLYSAAAALIAAGYADFALIAYHFTRSARFAPAVVPVLYAGAMGMAGLAGLVGGRLFDRLPSSVLLTGTVLGACFAPLVFLGSAREVVLGVVLWGLGLGVQESALRAAVANVVHADRRAAAYGVFDAGYGIAWFLGSALMGMLYDHSLRALIMFSVIVQLVAIPFFIMSRAPAARAT